MPRFGVVGCLLGMLGGAWGALPVVKADSELKPAPYADDWESLKRLPVPAWFEDGKFGIMIHWGPYSVAGYRAKYAYAEHFAHRLYRQPRQHQQFMKDRFGATPPEFGYKDLIPLFKAEHFSAESWARLFAEAGARYVIPVGEHHDGFAMWDSDLTTWDAKNRGPGRDVIGELALAVRKHGMVFGVSYHRERFFSYYGEPQFKTAATLLPLIQQEIERMPEAASLYGPAGLTDEFIDEYAARWKEISRKYQPSMMWIDDIPVFYMDSGPQVDKFKAACRRMIADYLNEAAAWETPVYLNNKGRNLNWPNGVGCWSADNLQLDHVVPFKWENPATLGKSYGYCLAEDENDQYKSVTELVHLLTDVVSKNGNLLLNIGPKADGTIPDNQARRLRGIGHWLRGNGEAIYGTRPWSVFGEGDSVRFTVHDRVLNAIRFERPEAAFTLTSLRSWPASRIQGVTLLGHGPASWSMTEQGLRIEPPAQLVGEHAWVFQITCDQPLDHLPATNPTPPSRRKPNQ